MDIFSDAAWSFFEVDEERMYEEPAAEEGDIELPFGSFLVCETGVTVNLEEPFSIWSGHKSWSSVAPNLAALWLVVTGEGELGGNSFCDKVLSVMSTRQRDVFEERLDADWMKSADILIKEWAPLLATKCPHKSVSDDLKNLRVWDAPTLDRYANQHFLG